jgi:alpha-methylacyl-CoA racemase
MGDGPLSAIRVVELGSIGPGPFCAMGLADLGAEVLRVDRLRGDFYDVYRTADGGWLSVAAIEPQFYRALLELLGLADEDLPDQHDRERWPELKERFAEVIRGRTRAGRCAAAESVVSAVAAAAGEAR